MSIALAASFITSLVVGGVTTESDGHAAVTDLSADYVSNELRFSIQVGTTAGAKFTPGTAGATYTCFINAITGAWTISGTAFRGTLSGAALTSIQNTFKSLRNTAETFIITQGMFSGSTRTDW